MISRPAIHAKLTQELVNALENHFDNGMKLTPCLQQIKQATVVRSSLSAEKVKVKYLLYSFPYANYHLAYMSEGQIIFLLIYYFNQLRNIKTLSTSRAYVSHTLKRYFVIFVTL